MEYKIENKTFLTDDTFVLTLQKPDFKFKSGQWIKIVSNTLNCSRKYSIYSGENDEKLEILIKEVIDGKLTPKLKNLNIGDVVDVDNPAGKFILDPIIANNNKIVFIASGTGISPFRSMIKTNKNINYQLIHGVKYHKEAYNMEEYDRDKYILCTSQDMNGDFFGRVTSYIINRNFDNNTHFYLCGNHHMILDAVNILKNKGFDKTQIHREVYF